MLRRGGTPAWHAKTTGSRGGTSWRGELEREFGSGARAPRSRRSSGERWMDGSGRRDGGWLGMDPERTVAAAVRWMGQGRIPRK